MALYRPKGSKRYVMDFMFHGQRIRESTGMSSLTRAQKVLDNRRRELEDGTAGIRKRKRPGLLSVTADEWRELRKSSWAPSTQSIIKYAFDHLMPVLGKRLVVDIEARDIVRYQTMRLEDGASSRTVNIEVGVLRRILRAHGVWARVAPDVTMLAERQDVGRALTAAEESQLLLECGRSRSRILLPFVVLLLETGARFNTVRRLQWGNVDFVSRYLQFGKDKTAAGSGRTIPLSQRAIETLQFWATQFPRREPSHYIFPAEEYGAAGTADAFGFTASTVISSDPTRPTGSVKTAWQAARARTRRHCPLCHDGILVDKQKPEVGYYCFDCRFEVAELPEALSRLRMHDARHTACSRMIAARVPLPIIGKIVGWSPSTLARMSARYGHFQLEEMRSAVESINRRAEPEISGSSPRISPQRNSEPKTRLQ